MKFLSIVFSVVFALSVTGCSMFNHVTGTKITDAQLASVTKGTTDLTYILGTFGTPSSTMQAGEKTMYVYNYNVINSFGKNVGESVTFIVNKKEIVEEILVNRNSNNGAKNPLLEAAGVQ